jgi:hypothetical protein
MKPTDRHARRRYFTRRGRIASFEIPPSGVSSETDLEGIFWVALPRTEVRARLSEPVVSADDSGLSRVVRGTPRANPSRG